MSKTTDNLYNRQEFANKIGATRQWVGFKIKQAIERGLDTITFYKNGNINKPIEVRIVYTPSRSQIMLEEI